MKKKIVMLLAGVIMVISLFSFARKYSFLKQGIYTPIRTADISFIVYKSYDYTQSLYSTCVAGINLTVEKVNSKGEATAVWKKNIDSKSLSQYPSIAEAIKQNVAIPGATKKSEYLVLKYDVIYNTNGHKLDIPTVVPLSEKSTNTVAISI